ncbi:MAG: insulinase family protein [Bdellovibrionales bacterium]|nr:insulinase family protein [Bdellovibrionales bacterium]
MINSQKNVAVITAFFALGGTLAGCSSTPKSTQTAGVTSQPAQPGVVPAVVIEKSGNFELIPIAGKFVAKRTKLDNGLKLIVVEDDSSPTFAYYTWMDVGSRNEVFGKTGLAHLFEHLMFKGTKNHKEGEFDAILEKAGVEGENAFTSTDHTVYHQELPKEHLELIMNLESDRMNNLVVNDDSFKTEREVVQEERRMRKENSPEGMIYQTLFETAYIDHPYHWPVIGYEQDLNMMSAQDARDFYEHYYTPDRATVVVVGDVDADKVLKLAKKYYGNLQAKNTPNVEHKTETPQVAQRRKKLELNIQVEKLWMAYKIGPSNTADTPVFEVIQAILSDGMNSRLNRALVDNGIAASVGSGSFSLRDPGLFAIMADLQKGKHVTLAEPIITRELERLKNNPVSEDELKRAKNLIRFHFLERLATHGGQAYSYGEFETEAGGMERLVALQNEIQAVTPEQIMKTSKEYFKSSGVTVVVGVPKKTIEKKNGSNL